MSEPASPAPSSPPPGVLVETAAPPRRRWYGNILVPLTALAAAGVIVVLFAAQWDRWIGISVRQVTDDAYVRGVVQRISRPTGLCDPVAQGLGMLAPLVQHEAYVLAYIDAFWLIAWVSLLGILLVLPLRRSPPNPLTPPLARR